MSYDFNKITDRKNTNAIKYDLAVARGKPADVLSLWVADMDFPTSPAILEALQARVQHGIFGYSVPGEDFYESVKKWQKEEHDFEITRHWVVTTPGVVFAIACAIKAFTLEGEAVIIQTPVYYPFKNMILANKRKLVTSSLFEKDGKWQIDFEDFERKIVENDVKLFILCSPHNPVGRVWTREELTRLSEICLRHNVLVFADEIHNDFVFEGHKHTVFSTISKEAAWNSVISTSASKTFNLAGLQFSVNFIQNPALKKKFHDERDKTGYDEPSLMGFTATQAAYEKGKEWLLELKKHLASNLDFVRTFVKEKLPKARLIEPEGTYLLWLDFSGYGYSDSELDDIIVNKAKVWLDRGTMFGLEGEGYQRINIATPRALLQEALERISKALQ
ncbi:pyridoxal phosphate-dependent aminotransferase [Treponema ruminis]|uniref:cysteine-S-conjugate beta-lyase n=1 Tax=Treponema ruminis TaxID=744515 RepID=A0A7W8G9T7_9SPIR|nr:MalY/PatB family protein [Treponema ruminis]MBB5226470.1 cystathionine beta-lyase [Treponema ruminis]QSI02625.1 pyridoxal phosphate-dependent aminotransferase [Treponema ruminis]